MPITITVEDGSIVTGANSYVTLTEARNYALDRGVTLSAVDDTLAAQLIKSTDYLEAQGCRFQGQKVNSEQELQWPRYGVYIDDFYVESDEIPKQLKNAQLQLAMAIEAGFDLQPNVLLTDYIVKEKVDVLETEYANPLAVGVLPTLTAAEQLLKVLYGNCNTGSFKTVRV